MTNPLEPTVVSLRVVAVVGTRSSGRLQNSDSVVIEQSAARETECPSELGNRKGRHRRVDGEGGAICSTPARTSAAFRANLINLFWRNSQPFQEPLVPIRMAGFEEFVPLHPLLSVQSYFFIHCNPFFFADMFFHSLSRFVMS